MKQFKYLTEDDGEEGVWVCEACKKQNSERILLGKWKLIAISAQEVKTCKFCSRKTSARHEVSAA
jgi:ribosomal protein L37AE/L43A